MDIRQKLLKKFVYIACVGPKNAFLPAEKAPPQKTTKGKTFGRKASLKK